MPISSIGFNFINTINPFFCFKKRDLDDSHKSQKANTIYLGEIGKELNPDQIEIISKQISLLEARISELNNIFKLSENKNSSNSENSSSSTEISLSSVQPDDNFKQKISSLRTQLLDLGCEITAQMVTNMLGLTPSEAGKSSRHGNNEWQSIITTLNNFLIFLEIQAKRLEQPNLPSEEFIGADIHSFFQKTSISLATHPFIFTLNTRLAILKEKFYDLEGKPAPTSNIAISGDYLHRISDDIAPEKYKILEQISEIEDKIEKPDQEIKKVNINKMKQAMAATFGL